ncbi:MAG: hypothetical protein LBD94_01635 [Rickettsiales bacterium]|jgi:hypothetical protein|nr:hypothetical protein [Rickettsiales bacterium]
MLNYGAARYPQYARRCEKTISYNDMTMEEARLLFDKCIILGAICNGDGKKITLLYADNMKGQNR